MTTLTVGTGQQYATLTAAVAAAKTGDTINVQAGTYTNDFPAQINGLTIQGVGGIATLVATNQPSNGKAILDVAGNTTLRNLDISGVTVPDANGAAIRYESGNLLIQNTVIHGNQNGILGAPDPAGTITIDGSEFYNNGTSSGSTHNIYIGDIATFTLTNSYIHDANTGHEVKSRAENNVITNNRIEDGSSTASYQIDLPNGGNATIAGNTIQKSASSGNHVTIAYGEEGNPHAGTSVSIANNTFVSDQSGAYVIWDTTNAAVAASGNSTFNYSQIDKSGHVTNTGFTPVGSRPTLDTSSHIDTSGGSSGTTPPTTTPTPTPPPVSDTTAPTLTVTESASGISNRANDTISGSVDDSGSGVARVEIYDTTGGRTLDLGAATLASGAYSFAASGLADGSHAFTAIAIDRAGNSTKATSAGASLTVDTSAPALTATESVSGVTTKTSNVISGTATDVGAGTARVEIYDTTGGRTVDLGAATLNGTAWSFTASNLTTGNHAFSAVATDNAGNVTGPVSAGATETIAAVPPPTVASHPTIQSASVARNTFVIKGIADARSTVVLTDKVADTTRIVGTTTAAADGTWSITPATIATRAVNVFAATATSGTDTTASTGSLILSSAASETLSGTGGKPDVFAFSQNFGRDLVRGFETTAASGGNHDVIDFAGTAYHSFADVKPAISGSGSTAVIRVNAYNSITLTGVAAQSLQASDFRFS